MAEIKDRIGRPGEFRPGGRRARIPVQHRSPHTLPTTPEEPDIRAAFEPNPPLPGKPVPSKDFGQLLPYEPKPGEKFSYQTLRQGRLMRIGIVGELESEAQTQVDVAAPPRTVVTTYNYDKGFIRVEPDYGNVNWRYAPVSSSNQERKSCK